MATMIDAERLNKKLIEVAQSYRRQSDSAKDDGIKSAMALLQAEIERSNPNPQKAS